jgi:hypothetical protein
MDTNFRTSTAHIGISRVIALGLALHAFLSCCVSARIQFKARITF